MMQAFSDDTLLEIYHVIKVHPCQVFDCSSPNDRQQYKKYRIISMDMVKSEMARRGIDVLGRDEDVEEGIRW